MCERFLQNHKYLSKEHSSFEVTLNVTHLDTRHKNSKGWLSQEGEDRWLYEHFFHGVESRLRSFVEIGGLDGVLFSNTYILSSIANFAMGDPELSNFASHDSESYPLETLRRHSRVAWRRTLPMAI